VRQISGDLRPESLYSLGLIPALEQFCEKLHHQNPGTNILLDFRPLEAGSRRARIEETLDDKRLLHLYRVIQEAVRNAIKHAAPRRIEVSLEESLIPEGTDSLRVCIEDDGPGLPWPEVPPDDALIQQGHLGIVGLKERVRELSGQLTLANRTPEPGARLEIVIE
jgi:two-component system sensor histidine kinase DegS